jgi:hypothetical protein
VLELLLAIIAACLLFGGAAVLGFLETAFWLILFLAVVVIVVLVVRALVKGVTGIIDSLSPRRLLLAIIAACLLFGGAAALEFWDVVALIVILAAAAMTAAASRAVHENASPRRLLKIKMPPRIHGVRFTDWEDYLDWANRTGRWTEQDHELEERDRRARIWLDQQLGRRGEGL